MPDGMIFSLETVLSSECNGFLRMTADRSAIERSLGRPNIQNKGRADRPAFEPQFSRSVGPSPSMITADRPAVGNLLI